MTQKIVIDGAENHPFTANELDSVVVLARMFPQHDLRLNTDPTNLKVYIGQNNRETHRYWFDKESGFLGLIEKDFAVDSEDSDWQQTNYVTARNELSK